MTLVVDNLSPTPTQRRGSCPGPHDAQSRGACPPATVCCRPHRIAESWTTVDHKMLRSLERDRLCASTLFRPQPIPKWLFETAARGALQVRFLRRGIQSEITLHDGLCRAGIPRKERRGVDIVRRNQAQELASFGQRECELPNLARQLVFPHRRLGIVELRIDEPAVFASSVRARATEQPGLAAR